MLKRFVIVLVNTYQSITSSKVEAVDSTGKVRVWNQDGSSYTDYNWSDIAWGSTTYTEVQTP